MLEQIIKQLAAGNEDLKQELWLKALSSKGEVSKEVLWYRKLSFLKKNKEFPADLKPVPDHDTMTIEEIIEGLDVEERLLIKQRYAEMRTLQEIGNKHGCSRERVRQKEQRALRKLRKKLEIQGFSLDKLLRMV